MAYINGRNARIRIGLSVIQDAFNFSYTGSAERVEVTALGDTEDQYINGLEEGSISFEYYLDDEASVQSNIQEGATVGLTVNLDGAGNPQLGGSMYIDEVSYNVSVKEPDTVSVSGTGYLIVSK